MSRAIQLLQEPATAPRGGGVRLLGRIAAGAPIEAIEQDDEVVDFEDWEGRDDKFALRVTGESMIEEHIADGDYVIIKRAETARDGQIVAVRDDDGEATLKRFFREKNRVRLEPANSTMKPIFRDQGRHPRRPRRRRPQVLIRSDDRAAPGRRGDAARSRPWDRLSGADRPVRSDPILPGMPRVRRRSRSTHRRSGARPG